MFWLLHAAIIAAFLLVPLNAIWRALPYLPGGGDPADPHDVGLRRWPLLLANTLIVSSTAVVSCLAFGTLLGALTARFDFRLRGWLRFILLSSACLPAFVAATVIFAIAPPWALPRSPLTIGAFYGLLITPLAALLIDSALRRSNRALDETALMETGPIRAMLFAALPSIRGVYIGIVLFVVVLTATDCTLTDLLQVRTFAEEVYTQFALRRSPAGPLLTGLPVIVSCTFLLLVGQSRWVELGIGGETPVDESAAPIRPTRETQALLSLGAVFLTLLLLIPAAALVARTQSLSHFLKSLRGFQNELGNSLLISACSAVALVFVAIGLATMATRMRVIGALLSAAVALMIAMPAPLVGISVIDLLNHHGWRGNLYDSRFVLAIGYLARYLPIAVLLLMPAVQRLPRELDWQVRLDGGDLLTFQGSIVRPLIARETACAFLILFLLCFSEVPCTILICPPGVDLASVRAFSLLHFGVYADWAALAIASGIISLVVAASLLIFSKRQLRENR